MSNWPVVQNGLTVGLRGVMALGGVGSAVLSISGTPVTTAIANVAYAGFTVSGAGGSPAYTYTVSTGTLPTGITLDAASGSVSGTPTVVGTQSGIVIRVTDANGAHADLGSFQIAVTAPEQYAVPSIGGLSPAYLNETSAGTSQYLVPGFAYVNEQGV